MTLHSRLCALERAASAVPPTCPACGPAPVTDQTVIALDGKTPELGVCDVCGGRIGKNGAPLGREVVVITMGTNPAHAPTVPGDDGVARLRVTP